MAGTIESLKFDVILEDKEFKRKVNDDINLAKKLNTSLSNVIKITKPRDIISSQGVKNAQEMVTYLSQIEQKIKNMPKGSFLVGDADQLNKTLQLVNANLDKIINKQKQHKGEVSGTNAQLVTTSSILRTLSMLTGTAFSVVGIRRFLSSLIDITGQFEVQRMALRNMLQDVDAADAIFQDLYRFSSESTYRFSELAKYAKQLAAFNIDKGSLLETTKMLGDVASGVGVSMDRIILAYGHVKSSGFLRGIQLRSFAQNGVPVLEELSKMFTEIEGKAVSLGDVFDKMTKREISFEMVEEAFRRMTSEGGKFYQMQEVLARTLSGQINILKGRWENLLAAMGNANSGLLKDTVHSLSEMVSSMENFGRALKTAGVAIGAYEVAMITLSAVTKTLTWNTTLLTAALGKVWALISKNPWALLAAGVAVAAAAIYKANQEISYSENLIRAYDKIVEQHRTQLAAEISAYDALYAKLKLAKEGTDEYKSAKDAILAKYGDYINELREEGREVNDLTNLYDDLKTKIEAASRARFRDTAFKNLEETNQKQVDSFYEHLFNQPLVTADSGYKLKTLVSSILGQNAGSVTGNAEKYFSQLQQEAIWQYVTGGVSRDTLQDLSGKYPELAPVWFASDYLDELKSDFDNLTGTYADKMTQLNEMFKAQDKQTQENTKTELKEWRKLVSDAISGLDEDTRKKAELDLKENEDYYDYLERVGKKYKELREEQDKALTKDKAGYKTLIDGIKGVDKALEGNILKDARYNREPWNGSTGSGKDPFADAISSKKADAALLEKYKAAYEKLEPLFGEEAARAWVFNKMGYDVQNLDRDFEKIIDDLKRMGESGKEAGEALEARLGLDEASKAAKEFQKSQKALEAYKKALEKFDKDWGDGESRGAAYDIEKAVRDYHNEDKKIDEEYLEAQMAIFEAHQDNVDAIKEETDKLEKLYKARKNANKNKFVETVRGKAEKIFKEQLQGFDLTNWNDKTLSQINAIRDAIQNVEIPPEILKDLEDDTNAAAELAKALFQLKKDTIENTVEPERFKKIAKEAKRIAGYLGDAAGKMREFADATGNTKLGEAAEIVGMLAQNIQAAAEGAESWGGWWGAIIGGLTDIFNQVTTGLTDAMNASKQLAATLREIQTEAWILSNTSMFSNDGIFGTNSSANLRGTSKAMQQLRDDMASLGDPRVERAGRTFWEKLSVGWRKIFNPNHVGLTEEGYQGTLAETMRKYRLNVYDEYGNFDAASIREIIKLFGDEDGALERLAKDSEAYAEAMRTVEEAMSDVFGEVASSLAEQIVDTWWEAGEAALDYADILEDVAKAYAKMIVQDTLLDSVFNDEKKEALKQAFVNGDASKAMAIVAEAMQEAEDMLPTVESALAAFEPYRNMNAGGDANSLGSGIKSITEETASLLASYVNSIRDDVSVIRGIIENRAISEESSATGAPTLNEYMAQVASNTYEAASNTADILSWMKDVIGAPGTTGMVVRVEVQ